MAKKPCCVCENLVGFADRNDLKNGVICDECWAKVKEQSPGMKVSFTHTVEDVLSVFNKPAGNSQEYYSAENFEEDERTKRKYRNNFIWQMIGAALCLLSALLMISK